MCSSAIHIRGAWGGLGRAREISVGRREGRFSRAYAKAASKRKRHCRCPEEHTLSSGWGTKMLQTRGQSAGAEDALWGLMCDGSPCGQAELDLGAFQPLVLISIVKSCLCDAEKHLL